MKISAFIDRFICIIFFSAVFTSMAPQAASVPTYSGDGVIVKQDIQNGVAVYDGDGGYSYSKSNGLATVTTLHTDGTVGYSHVDSKGNVTVYSPNGETAMITRTDAGVKIARSDGTYRMCDKRMNEFICR